MMAQSQEVNEKESTDPKFYISPGLGVDHQFLGAKFVYQITDKFSVNATLGILAILSNIPSFGAEYYFLDQTPEKRFSPYIGLQLGRPIEYVVYTEERSNGGNFRNIENKYVSGFTLVAGLSYYFPSKEGRLTLGVTYTDDINPSRLQDFVVNFAFENAGSGTIIGNSNSRTIFFTVGYQFPLRKLFRRR